MDPNSHSSDSSYSHKPIALGLVLVFVTASLSGCLFSTSEESMPVNQPAPGETYHYMGEDQTELIALISKVSNRYDGFMRTHESIIIDYILEPAELRYSMSDGNKSFHFQEAIENHERLISQQYADCGFRMSLSTGAGGEQEYDCYRRANVLFGGMGLPGGLGSSVFWGEKVKTGTLQIETHHIDPILGQLTYVAEPESTKWGDCLKIESEGIYDHHFRGLPWTVITGPFTLCPDYALPVKFTLEVPLADTQGEHQGERIEFRLTNTEESEQHPIFESPGMESGWSDSESLRPLHQWGQPFPLDAPEPDWPFTSIEAHEAGLEQSKLYRSLFEADDPPVFVRNAFGHNGGSQSPILFGNTTTFDRVFVLATSNGDRYSFVFSKTVREGGMLGNSSEITLDEERSLGNFEVQPTNESFTKEMISPKDAFDLAWELSRPDIPDDQKYMGPPSTMHTLSWGAGWWSLSGEPPERTDGLELVIRFLSEQAGDGFGVRIPHETRFDGPTGSLIHLSLYNDDPPFGP